MKNPKLANRTPSRKQFLGNSAPAGLPNFAPADIVTVLQERNQVVPFPLDNTVWVRFSVDSAVVPGQPVPITWEVVPGMGSGLVAGTRVDATVSLNGNDLWKKIHVPVSTPQHDEIVPANDFDATLLYKISTKTLRLEISGPPRAAGPWTANANLVVIPERIDQSWWQWDNPQNPIVTDWKKSYPMNGRLLDRSLFGQMDTAYVQLTEDSNARGSFTAGRMNPGTQIPIAFPSITQDWQWIITGVWAVTGPLVKEFHYVVEFSFVDHYGNGYPVVQSTPVTVSVGVALGKRMAGATAMAAAADAVYWAAAAGAALAGFITAFGAPALFAVAAGWYAAATTAGKVAQDPPEPDPRYREPVKLQSPRHLQVLDSNAQLKPIGAVISAVEQVFTASLALSEIEGRWMGARDAGDRKAMGLQAASYETVRAGLLKTVARVNRLAGEADRVLSNETVVSGPTLHKFLTQLQENGLPNQLRELATEADVSWESVVGLETAVRDLRLTGCARLLEGFGLQRRIVAAVEAYGAAIKRAPKLGQP
jgi:hypothetical protein